MTNILLLIIIVLLFARLVLMVNQGKRTCKKSYATTSEVDYHMEYTVDFFSLSDIAKEKGKIGWELVSILPIEISGKNCYYLTFTKRKIKNYYEG